MSPFEIFSREFVLPQPSKELHVRNTDHPYCFRAEIGWSQGRNYDLIATKLFGASVVVPYKIGSMVQGETEASSGLAILEVRGLPQLPVVIREQHTQFRGTSPVARLSLLPHEILAQYPIPVIGITRRSLYQMLRNKLGESDPSQSLSDHFAYLEGKVLATDGSQVAIHVSKWKYINLFARLSRQLQDGAEADSALDIWNAVPTEGRNGISLGELVSFVYRTGRPELLEQAAREIMSGKGQSFANEETLIADLFRIYPGSYENWLELAKTMYQLPDSSALKSTFLLERMAFYPGLGSDNRAEAIKILCDNSQLNSWNEQTVTKTLRETLSPIDQIHAASVLFTSTEKSTREIALGYLFELTQHQELREEILKRAAEKKVLPVIDWLYNNFQFENLLSRQIIYLLRSHLRPRDLSPDERELIKQTLDLVLSRQ